MRKFMLLMFFFILCFNLYAYGGEITDTLNTRFMLGAGFTYK